MGERWDLLFHTDSQAAASVFGGLVTSTAAVTNLGMTDFVNHPPAWPGDQLRGGLTVTERRLSKSRPGGHRQLPRHAPQPARAGLLQGEPGADPLPAGLMERSLRYYEDLEVGSTAATDATYLVTEEEVLEFGRRFDPQPFHTDPEAAAASVFGG